MRGWLVAVLAVLGIGLPLAVDEVASRSEGTREVLGDTNSRLYEYASPHLGRDESSHSAWVAEINREAAGCSSTGRCWLPDNAHWCGSFAGHCVRAIGLEPPANYFRAREWVGWGEEQTVATARRGDVVVTLRTGGHHVAILHDPPGHQRPALLLGGNQSNAVKVGPTPGRIVYIGRPIQRQ